MAAGTVGTIQRMKVVGSKTVPHYVDAIITFGTGGSEEGRVTVNATDLEASKILGIFGATVWGATAELSVAVSTTTAFSASGVTSVLLQIVDDDSDYNDQGETATVLFKCE